MKNFNMNKKVYLAILVLFLFWAKKAEAQKKRNIDSLQKVYRTMPNDTSKIGVLSELYYGTFHNDLDLAEKYARQSLSLSKQFDYKLGIAHSNYVLGSYHNTLIDSDSAEIYLKRAFEQFTKLNNQRGIFISNHLMGAIANRSGKYEKALEIFSECIENRTLVGDSMKLAGTYIHRSNVHENMGNHRIAYNDVLSALSIYDKINQPLWKADALYQLGVLDAIFKNYDKAAEYSVQAFEIYEEYNDKKFMGTSANGIGAYYLELEEYEKAIDYLNKSITFCKEVNLPAFEGAARRHLGMVFIKQKKYSEGIASLNQALRINRESGPPIQLISSLKEIGNAYNEINNPKQALIYFDEAAKMQEETAIDGNPSEIYEGKAKSLELLNDYKNALASFKKFKSLNDSVFNSKKIKQIEELRTIYDTEKKEQQIVLQEKEITVLEQQAEISTLQKILLGGGLVLSLIGFYGIRQKLKRNKLEKEKVDAELAFKRKELTTHALHLAKKNEVLEGLKQRAQELKENEQSQTGYQQLIRTINFDLQDDNNWENFSRYFEEVHKDFNRNLKTKYPQVTSNELRLLALLKMNLSSKEIANILNISPEGIKKARYRLRKKLDITTEDSLQDLVLSL